MKYLIVTAFYPPQNSSAAIQMHDLAREFIAQGHQVNVFIADDNLKNHIELEKRGPLNLIRFKVLKITNIKFSRRLINEFIMPFQIIFYSIIHGMKIRGYDGIIWYSPSPFFSPLILFLKLFNNCKTYLILRDIFPRWIKDLGLIKKNIIYSILESYTELQFLAANIIGVQSKGNIKFIKKNIFNKSSKVTVLNNWLSKKKVDKCKLNLSNSKFKDKKIIIYAGNMGISQDMKTLIDLANTIQKYKDIVFLFIGRGTEFYKSKIMCEKIGLKNIFFENEISANQVADLYSKCFCGLIVLDRRHKTHNIPGKLLSYLQAGLPVFAVVNEKNDLIKIVNKTNVGFATDNYEINFLKKNFTNLLNKITDDIEIKGRCRKLANTLFNTSKIVKEIIKDLK